MQTTLGTSSSRSRIPAGTWLLALVTAILWGSSFAVTKAILAEWQPLSVAAGRWSIAALFLAVLLAVTGQGGAVLTALRKDLWPVIRFGFVGVALLYAVQNVALQYTTAANASVLGNLVPLIVAGLSVLFLGERLSPRLGLGIGAATAGALVFSLEGNAFTVAPDHLLGDGLTLVSALAGAVYVVQGKTIVTRYSPAVVTALAAGVGAFFLLPMAFWLERIPPMPTVGGAFAILGLGLGASVAANLAWWHVAERMPASQAAVFILLVPVVGAGLGVAWMGDPLTPAAVFGAMLIVSGVYLAEVG